MKRETRAALQAAKRDSRDARKILKQGNTPQARLAARRWLKKQGK